MALKETIKIDVYICRSKKEFTTFVTNVDVTMKQLESFLDSPFYRVIYKDDNTQATKDNMLEHFIGGGGDAPVNYITFDEYNEDGYVTKATIKNNIIPPMAFASLATLTDCRTIGTTSIGTYAFERCSSLAWTSLPDGITSIGDGAFEYCDNLALTSLPDELTSIGVNTFRSCFNLALTKLPDGITSIGEMAFYECTSLTLTELPAGLKDIEYGAFSICENLALTSLPAGLTSIGENAFYDCTSLTSLTFKGTPDSIASDAFEGCTNLVDIKVPWSSGAVTGAPWGATNAVITYNYVPTT